MGTLLASFSVIVAYLQPTSWIVLPGAKERTDGLIKKGDKGIQLLHGDGIIEANMSVVIVQVHSDPGGVPVVGHGDPAVVPAGVQSVLLRQAPVSFGGRETDEAFSVAVLCGDSQVPHPFIPHVHLPVMLSAGILGCGQDPEESREAPGQVRFLAANVALLHFCIEVGDDKVWVGRVGVQGKVLRH